MNAKSSLVPYTTLASEDHCKQRDCSLVSNWRLYLVAVPLTCLGSSSVAYLLIALFPEPGLPAYVLSCSIGREIRDYAARSL
jgi:hypothetical protein